MRPRGTFATLATRAALALLLIAPAAGCKHNCRTDAPKATATAAPATTPRETIAALIASKENSAREARAKDPARDTRAKFFTARAAAALDKLDSLEKEMITEVKTTGSTAAVSTKKQLYEIDPKSGIIAPAPSYEERLYTLKLENGTWKIDNAAFRTRSADEYGGFAPRWQTGMDAWR